MKRLLVSKPIIGMLVLLLAIQMACVASSISPTNVPATMGAPASGSKATQAVPNTGSSTQPPSNGQATQAVPNTGANSTQASPGGASTSSAPASGGTPADAQAMLQAVVQHYQAAGRDQALKDFTDKNPPFNSPDMFVMCLGSDHKITAMGGFPLLVGVSADTVSLITGQSLGQVIWDAASLDPQGTVPFQWKNPLTQTQESKTLYYQKLSQDVCGVVANTP